MAAILNTRLEVFQDQTVARSQSAEYLTEGLTAIDGITPPHVPASTTRHAYHLYMMQYDADEFGGHCRDEFVAALSAEGVPCSPGYTRPLSEEPALVGLREKYPNLIKRYPCPNVERICARGVWLFQSMLLASRDAMDDVVEATAKIRNAFRTDSTRVGG